MRREAEASSLNLCWFSVDYDSLQMKQECWVGTWFCGLEMWVFISMRRQSKLEWGLILGTGSKIRFIYLFEELDMEPDIECQK